jgi:hypothetical protein
MDFMEITGKVAGQTLFIYFLDENSFGIDQQNILASIFKLISREDTLDDAAPLG